jgi:hypothetical protein
VIEKSCLGRNSLSQIEKKIKIVGLLDIVADYQSSVPCCIFYETSAAQVASIRHIRRAIYENEIESTALNNSTYNVKIVPGQISVCRKWRKVDGVALDLHEPKIVYDLFVPDL